MCSDDCFMKHKIEYIQKNYPTNPTHLVAKQLNLSPHQVRSLAIKHNINKCEHYKRKQIKSLTKHRRQWYEANIPLFKPTHEQEQIILGSLLGDGYISRGAQRSINCHYQEHFGDKQRAYRQWKLSQLKNLGFNIKRNYLRSISHPYFTELYAQLYPNNIKSLTPHILKKCTHPIFLSTLYFDDGSLTITYTYNKNSNIVYCHPSIILYTLNFTKEENILLANHLNKTFNTHFVVSGHPDGHQSLLKINKASEVSHFLQLIQPYVKTIPSMKYKTCITTNINEKTPAIKKRFGQDVTMKASSSSRRRLYTMKKIETIIDMKQNNMTDQVIADYLNRTYWAIVYKVRELRRSGQL